MIYTVMNRCFFTVYIAAIIIFSSCSLKEDRNGCPCWMSVDLSHVDPGQIGHDGSVVLRLRDNSDEDAVNYEYQATESVSTKVGTLEYEVPRGAVGVSAVAFGGGITGQTGNDGKSDGYEIRIPVGEQMDSLYGFFKCFHTRRESVRCDVKLHKEFCNVSFTLVDEDYAPPYTIEVRGNVVGVSVWDLMPVQGIFRYTPKQENGVYNVRIPRQIDNSLELVLLGDMIADQAGNDGKQVVRDGKETEHDSDSVVERFPLGEYIARSGYDWTAEDLADVNIALDLEMQQVMITVSGWDGVVMMDIVI